MLLFVVSTNLSYCIFTYTNEKFTCIFVKVFTKLDATGPHFYKSSYRLKKNSEPDFMLFALALQIVSV